jgi:hypothetical protein
MSNGNCAEVGAWRKAEASIGNGDCAEVGAWRKAVASMNGGDCVEAGYGDAVIGIRDTKQDYLGDDRTVLEFSPGAWGQFLAAVREA